MKFQPDHAEGVNLITRHEPGRLWVAGRMHEGSVVVPWQGPVLPWPVADVGALEGAHLDQILALKPELVILGSGTRMRFAAPRVLAGLMSARVGFETMDTAAACRTYNVLASERRKVVAALIDAA
jgi:uncharacterized protein